MKTILVTGAAGFVGSALIYRLAKDEPDTRIRAVSSRPLELWKHRFSSHNVLCERLDLMDPVQSDFAVSGCDEVYNFAAKVGGIKFIKENNSACMSSAVINHNLLCASEKCNVKRFFFSSSACVYPDSPRSLVESDAYPAYPETEYGWEKIFSERLCYHFEKEGRVKTRVARYFTLFGPGDCKEANGHVIEALCRKVIMAPDGGEVEVWGDGLQTRSFLFIDDCIEGTLRIMRGDFPCPVNLSLGTAHTINEIVERIIKLSGKRLSVCHNLSGVQGVRNRCSNNFTVRALYGWEPSSDFWGSLSKTYHWLTNS